MVDAQINLYLYLTGIQSLGKQNVEKTCRVEWRSILANNLLVRTRDLLPEYFADTNILGGNLDEITFKKILDCCLCFVLFKYFQYYADSRYGEIS